MSELLITSIPVGKTNAAVTFNAATGSDSFTPNNADGRVNLILKNANAQNAAVTLKAGDGMLAPLGDLTVAVAAGQVVFVPLSRAETARVKVTTGSNKGKVFLSTSVDSGGSIGNVTIGVVSVE